MSFGDKSDQEDAFENAGQSRGRPRDTAALGAPAHGPTDPDRIVQRPVNDPSRDNQVRSKRAELHALADETKEQRPYPRNPSGRNRNKYDERPKRGRIKYCRDCGGVMTKSSRMLLSPLAGILVLISGAGLMAFYGLATNFLQTPWFVKFALPAAYYVGSIFIGVGFLFFFLREKVWKCENCREVRKR